MNRPPVQVDVLPGTSFFGIPEGHVKQKMGEFNISGESQMEFEFRTFHKTAFITCVLNGQVCGCFCFINHGNISTHNSRLYPYLDSPPTYKPLIFFLKTESNGGAQGLGGAVWKRRYGVNFATWRQKDEV